MTYFNLIIIFISGAGAGFVDAAAGGGGIIMLPALMAQGLPAVVTIGTNKLCGTTGVISSSWYFARKKQVFWPVALVMGTFGLVGSHFGSLTIGQIPENLAQKAVSILLVAVVGVVLLKPNFGNVGLSVPDLSKRQWVTLGLFGLVIGFYDGFFGPGTGIFLAFVLVYVGGLDFITATGTTKIINCLTNSMALFNMVAGGHLDYTVGFVGMCGVALGSFLGARSVTTLGIKLIKPIFVLVALVLIIRMFL